MFPAKQMNERFAELLSELDGMAENCAGEAAEDLEDLNAEFEDILLLVADLKVEAADFREEYAGALEDLLALAGDYEALARELPDLEEPARRLRMVTETAMGSLEA